ncbi:MAG: Asp-tRNA(Asn)/Glu-tRNA(Gln) amidotransferase GatCAB subunit B, partial [Bacteroidia bacterium]
LSKHCSNHKAAANWVMGDIKSYLNENATHISNFPLAPKVIASLIHLIEEGKVSHSTASQKIFPLLIENPAKSPLEIAQENNLIQESNADSILPMIEEVIAKYPEKVEEYRAGKKGLLGLFVGEVMKLSKGKADPKITNQLVREKLET